MSALRYLLIVCVVVLASLGGAAWGYAQAVVVPKPGLPYVLSGADIGFQVTGTKGDRPVGRLVVRVNGEWKEAEFAYGVKFLTK